MQEKYNCYGCGRSYEHASETYKCACGMTIILLKHKLCGKVLHKCECTREQYEEAIKKDKLCH